MITKQSLQRSEELTLIAQDFLLYKKQFLSESNKNNIYVDLKKEILSYFKSTESDWNDWKWQLKHRITNAQVLSDLFKISVERKDEINLIGKTYRWAITPYFLAQIKKFNNTDPIYLQTIPQFAELDSNGYLDPMDEANSNPAGAITRRYPDRVIINLTNCCAAFCRHCQRRRNIGEKDITISNDNFDESINYLKQHPEIRDVLLTGGDPLTLDNEFLDYVLKKIRSIKTVEIIRIGTRTIVTLPQRFDDSLLNILQKYSPLYINTQFNHPNELSYETEKVCEKLAGRGIILGNQMVFLKGVNDDFNTVALLNELLVKNRIRPYYIFHPKKIKGTKHFQISIEKGLQIYDKLRGNISGLAVPTYVYNAPRGLGKIPINRQMLDFMHDNKIVAKTWEGQEIELS